MMDVKEKVLQVMRSRAALQEKALGGEYPFTIATWNLRLAMEKEFPDEEWRSADLRKILMELAKDGAVSKDTYASRIGQAGMETGGAVMANLQLAVKGEYFDAMIRGEKTEEYRLCNDYWNKRIMFREYDRLIITKGYPKRDDSSRRIDVPYDGYEIKTITHPHFGDKPVKVFAIKVNIGNE